jgi:hypothetical protein
MDVVLERFNFENVEDLVEQLGARARPPLVLEIWEGMLEDLLGAERRLFDTARGWKDIKTSTVQRKNRDKDPRVRSNSYRTNIATGELRDFMTSRGPRAQPLELDADELRIGIPAGQSGAYYGRFQAREGRDPLVSRAIVRRIASSRVRDHLLGHTISGDFGTGSGTL